MNISIVICTRDRVASLQATLSSLLNLRMLPSCEVVIVDNGSRDAIQPVLEWFRDSSPPLELTSVVEPQPGLANARNRGWRTARGEIIAFTDDDCYPSDDFLWSVAECFQEDARLGFIGGRILLYDPTDFPITIQDHPSRALIHPGQFVPPGLIQGANMAIRRGALESVGGFDGRFGAGTPFPSEDVEVLARLSSGGWFGAYDPRPLVYHHHRRKTAFEADRLMKSYDRGRGAYYAKCIMNPRLRGTYLKTWYRSMRHQKLETTWREVLAAAEFIVRSAIQPARNRAS